MKKQIAAGILISALTLTGCASKGPINTDNKAAQRVNVNTNFKPVKPGTVQKLNSDEKSKLNSNLNSELNKIDKTLNSLQDAPEINLNSLDK